MLVNVRLNGVMGKEFGTTWKLAITTPRQALEIIQANTGRLATWIRANAVKYSAYRILVKFKNGKKEYLDKNTYLSARDIVSVSFTPVIEGAGGKSLSIVKVVIGAVMMVASIWLGPAMFAAGFTMAFGGVAELLTKKKQVGSRATSYYFQGVGKNENQGSPVPLIYGRCRVSGHTLSKAITVENGNLPDPEGSKSS